MGGGEALPNFCGTFSWVHFWSIKGVYFLQNANNLKTVVFIGCIYIVYYIVFLVLNWLSNLEFRRRQKLYKFPNGGVIWTKSKRTAVFPQETVPQSERGHFSSLTILMRAARARKRCEKRHTHTQTHRHWIFRHCSRSSSPKQDGTEIIEIYFFLANSKMLVWNG